MNAVEIEEAISRLAEQTFDAAEFPYAFLEAFGNKATEIQRLRKGNSNKTDVEGAVLQAKNIHLTVSPKGEVLKTLEKLKASPATSKQKAKFILATDGDEFQAEELTNGDTVACAYTDFPNHFGFFLPLAGISYSKEIKEVELDMKASNRLNRLYLELLKGNPEWGTEARRHDMNHFMARLIFCFFAEDTDIFFGDNLFTATIEQMSAKNPGITHEVISEIFRAMNTKRDDRASAKLPRWADAFPYVNGGLFSGSTETPRFSRIARSYLLHVGHLDWKKINPDIFGSMIQAVADDEERGSLGMHYTSVPNILKVLNPLFLDDLREQLAAAGDSAQKLLNLRKRMARIRVFDPACGSGNFLVIAYKHMREIEAEINKRRGEPDRRTDIPLTNFRGIELRDFPAEIARLALIIAEYQCDVLYRGQKEALAEFLPLDSQNWITCRNALRLDWLSICPPTGKGVKLHGDDLFNTPLDQAQIDFENEGGETYICGNPPYVGATVKAPKGASKQVKERLKKEEESRKSDLKTLFQNRTDSWKSLDYVAGWFIKAADYGTKTNSASAFVSTNSICQGQQVSILWPLIFKTGHEISFAHSNFKWANLASNNAGVTVVIVGISNNAGKNRRLFSIAENDSIIVKDAEYINAYLVVGSRIEIQKVNTPISGQTPMARGNMPTDGGNLVMSRAAAEKLIEENPILENYIRPFWGAAELISGTPRFVLWLNDENVSKVSGIAAIRTILHKVSESRRSSPKKSTQELAKRPHSFEFVSQNAKLHSIATPRVSSENRPYLPAELYNEKAIISDNAYAMYDAPLWNMALISSRLHMVWISTVCGQLETRLRYSNTLGWNTFPLPPLTEKNKADLTRCAEDILLARESHFPATIAELYDPDNMPENLRHAHERNDEVLERIYIGRRFRNDTERLEKLFELYTKMTAEQKKPAAKKARA